MSAAPAAPVDSLESGFHAPPDSARPHSWWHWMNGNVTREGITADLEAMKRAGIGGAQIFAVDCEIPAGPVKFLSPEWRGLMVHAAKEADRLGLELCLHNCAGWSSSGGPWNTPEHAMQRVATSEMIVVGPARFSGRLPRPPTQLDYYRDIAVLAFRAPSGRNPPKKLFAPKAAGEEKRNAAGTSTISDQYLVIENIQAKGAFNGAFVASSPAQAGAAPGRVVERREIVDLTSRLQPDGRVEWDVPPGDWILLRLGHTPTGRNNHPAPSDATGPECDKLSKEALEAHWAGFVQKVLEDLGPLAGEGRVLNNVLIDSYEVGGQNWTPGFREEFRKRRGYDPLLYLPTLTGRVVDSPEVSERFLWDLRRTIADLFAENYYGHFQELCHQRGLQASIEPYTGPFDSLQCGGKADIPMGEFWVGGAPGSSIKLAASVGHIHGRQVIGAESFTAAPSPRHGRWLEDAAGLKALGDLVFCQGVNRYIFHRYALQPWTNRWPGMTMGQWGTHFDRTSTWWEQSRAWLDYVARCQHLLQQGRFVADAAYFCGESAPVEWRAGDPALPAGYDYDGLDAGVLLQATVQEGRLMLRSGMSYRVLILPPSDRALRPALLDKLAGFVADGLTLVGAPPKASPSLEGYPQCDVEVNSLAARMWGDCDGRTVTEHKFGKGKVIWGQSLDQVLGALGVTPDFDRLNAPGARLAFIHRQEGDADIYFVSNQRTRYETVECGFRVDGKVPELWDPETGRVEPAPVWRREAGRTVVPLSFDPAGSVFVVFRAQARDDHLVAVEGNRRPVAEEGSKPAELHILKAHYGAFPGGGQSWLDVTADVKSLVAAGTRRIPAGNELAGEDPAPGVVKRLRIEFRLRGRQQMAEATEGKTLDLPAGSEVLSARYGHWPGGAQTRLDVTARVKSIVAGGTRRIPAGNELAGEDPAPNIVKQLQVTFRQNGRRQTLEAREGETLDLPSGAKVEKALYGQLRAPTAEREPTLDLTKKLADLVKDGQLNVRIDNELAGSDPAPGIPKELRVDYSLDGVRKKITVEESETLTLPETVASTGAPPDYSLARSEDGRMRMRVREPGNFDLTWASGRKAEVQCHFVPAPVELPGPWEVRFPPGWKAPAKVAFERLQSWPENDDPGVKYFSGTATYFKEFEIPVELTESNREVWLDLGRVKNFAEVSLNGRSLGILWKPPFRVNVTAAARPGRNALEIRITNLWPNRLIGDEQLPPDCEWRGKRLANWPQWLREGKPGPTGRLTFATWRHWTKDDALLDSGLLGPVTLQSAEVFVLP